MFLQVPVDRVVDRRPPSRVRQICRDPTDMLEARAGFFQERLHILHGLVGLFGRVFRVEFLIEVEPRLSTHVNSVTCPNDLA